ncbi:hypothetical protein SAMN05444375_10931 [Segatella baroniae B14]|nr:hypothetical protein SAMN05444375_10931 [Segatella baroniae B14]
MQNSFITNKDKLLSDIINGILPKSQSLERIKCVIRNMDKENKLILYKDEEGWVSVNTRLRN